MSAELTPSQRDIRWLFVQAAANGLPKPTGAHCEAFAERVALMMEDGRTTEAQARARALGSGEWLRQS